MANPQRQTIRRLPIRNDRNKLIAKIKMACKQLGIDDEDYRAMVAAVTGHDSLTKCSDAQLVLVVEHLKRKGFRPQPSKAKRGDAQHPVALKARVMWRSLHLLGEIRNPSEEALDAFACGQLKCERFAWARQSEGGKVIEALKDMATRNGWVQVGEDNKPLDVRGLNATLCLAILNKLIDMDEIDAGMTLRLVASRLFGINTGPNEPLSIDQLQRLAEALGKKLHKAKGRAR